MSQTTGEFVQRFFDAFDRSEAEALAATHGR
jgi:hypothetical protein